MEIKRLELNQKNKAAEVVASAFFDYPMFTPIFPDPKQRKSKMTWFFEKTLNCAMRYGEIFVTSDLSGVMFILKPGHTKLTQGEYIKNGFFLTPFVIGRKNYIKFDKYEKFAADIQEQLLHERDYYYLWGLATDPQKQGKGVGSALLTFLSQKADTEKIPIYLKTETKGNACYYERFGFKTIHASSTPISGLNIWCMLRDVTIK